MAFFLRIFLFFFFSLHFVEGQIYHGTTLVQPRLITDSETIRAGKSFRVGLLLKMAEGWHTYWKFPGDSGLATKVEWTLPPGFQVGELQWPTPEVENEDGDLQVYVYKGETLLFAIVTAPAKLPPGPIEIRVKSEWLVCEKLCVPGHAEQTISSSAGTGNPSADAAIFEKYASKIPSRLPISGLSWKQSGKNLILHFPGQTDVAGAFFFPNPPDAVLVGHPKTTLAADGLDFSIPLLDGSAPTTTLPGVLQIGQRVWELGQPPKLTLQKPQPSHVESGEISTLTLLPALFFGFLGGLILNLMPCVLPVISLKIFSFVKQSGESRKKIFRLGLSFAAGIFAWFLGLAVVLLIIRSSGSEISWARQFQNPWFNIGICVVIFLFALNLLGVYEITLPGSATTKLAGTGSAGNGVAGAFFQGVFATILGTPCTAPYLGTTLAFALAQPPLALCAVFAAIALGMSSPYLLLCANPGWMRFLPKPGIWMVRLKEFMGFLLLATMLWFIWIVGRQLGVNAIIFLGTILLLCGVGAWLYGVFLTPIASPGSKKLGWCGLILVVGLLTILLTGFRPARETVGPGTDFTEKLKVALATDRIVFVDFTADWCLSCKVNKRVAIDSKEVQKEFLARNVLFLEADWTNGDAEITTILKKYGRVGVPLYLIYPADRSKAPVLLPELLTPGLVTKAIEKI